LLLDLKAKLRFNPNTAWSGTPESLKAFAVEDSDNQIVFTSNDNSRKTFDTEKDNLTSAVSADPVSLATSVVQSNDAPILAKTGSASIGTTAEDQNSKSQTVLELFGSFFSDANDDPAANNFAGIAVVANTANATTQGSWKYSVDSGNTWNAVGTVSSTSALLLNKDALMRFDPNNSWNGSLTGSLKVVVVDDSTADFSFTSFNTTTNKVITVPLNSSTWMSLSRQ
jgi:hypothetical protein